MFFASKTSDWSDNNTCKTTKQKSARSDDKQYMQKLMYIMNDCKLYNHVYNWASCVVVAWLVTKQKMLTE